MVEDNCCPKGLQIKGLLPSIEDDICIYQKAAYPFFLSIVWHASTQRRSPAHSAERQQPAQNASTQRRGQPAPTDI